VLLISSECDPHKNFKISISVGLLKPEEIEINGRAGEKKEIVRIDSPLKIEVANYMHETIYSSLITFIYHTNYLMPTNKRSSFNRNSQ
jgi:hypothetical protein